MRTMKKEDILQKARKEGNGEYEERIQGRIMTRSALAVVALCAFFWLARVFQADRLALPEVDAWELPAIATGYAAFVHLWMYARLKTRVNLVGGLCCLVGFLAFTARFLMGL